MDGHDSDFDPYYEWLGISPKDQPPNHYRLLAIDLFEEHPNVIERAADRQMAFLRSLQTGSHSADSQRLLNEVARAKVCLLARTQKAAYDAELKKSFGSSSPVMPDSRAWYIHAGSEIIGPVSAHVLRQHVATGQVNVNTLVRLGDSGDWGAARNVKGLFDGPVKPPSTPPAANKSAGGAGQFDLKVDSSPPTDEAAFAYDLGTELTKPTAQVLRSPPQPKPLETGKDDKPSAQIDMKVSSPPPPATSGPYHGV